MAIKNIKLLLTDVDGVLTDGRVYASESGEFVGFDIQDGIGHKLAAAAGLKVGWLTGRESRAVALRAKRLGVPFLQQGRLDKLSVAEILCRREGLRLSDVAYIGDDLIDLPLLTRAGWSASVPYGRPEVRKAVDHVTKAAAGRGAFREVVEKILRAQGRWNNALKLFDRADGGPTPPLDDRG